MSEAASAERPVAKAKQAPQPASQPPEASNRNSTPLTSGKSPRHCRIALTSTCWAQFEISAGFTFGSAVLI